MAPRALRRLSAAQRQALECLRGFGAESLDDSFEDADVRSAYRALARRFHPDRYPEAGEDEREYLSHAFARIAEAYRQLTPGN